jgi:hypothetical protein
MQTQVRELRMLLVVKTGFTVTKRNLQVMSNSGCDGHFVVVELVVGNAGCIGCVCKYLHHSKGKGDTTYTSPPAR